MFSIIEDDGFFNQTDDDAAINEQVLNPSLADSGETTAIAGFTGFEFTGEDENQDGGASVPIPSFEPALDRFTPIIEFGNTEAAAEEARLEGIRKRRIENIIFPVGGA